MSDYKTSLLLKNQVPEFVREEHPKFIAFLEAYYEFLEQKQSNQKNDLTTEAKKLRYLSDIDESLDEFEKNFFNTYLSYVPQNTAVNKSFLLKNILPLYLSKGSESSFKFLFRILFGEDVQLIYPKNNILRSSDGKWKIENLLRVDKIIYGLHDGDGVTKEFLLAGQYDTGNIKVYVNNVLQLGNYYIRKETKKIIFQTAPLLSSKIKIEYLDFDTSLLFNRKITGLISGSTAIIERVNKRTIAGDNYFEFFISKNSLEGEFQNTEEALIDIIDGNKKLYIEVKTLTDVASITVIDGGANYNVGDPVLIKGTSRVTSQAKAIVDKIITGAVSNVGVLYGGAGFKFLNGISATGYTTEYFSAFVETVDDSGNVSPNTITFFTDEITDIDIANITIDAADYGFPSSNVMENANSIIANALTSLTVDSLGPITSVNITTSLITINPTFNVSSQIVNETGSVKIKDLGIIGRIEIVSSGQNYNVGEYLTFTNPPRVYSGIGANAQIEAVSANGSITKIKINSGGAGYYSDFPFVNVATANGTNANLVVTAIMGGGSVLQGYLPKDEIGNPVLAGQILSIKVINPGQGYDTVPFIDLTGYGNGLAIANAQLQNSYITLPGRWITTDGLLSSVDRKLEGNDYYIDYSYVLSSKIEFSKYRDILKNLMQPAGFIQYGEYVIKDQIQSNVSVVNKDSIKNTVSGTVNVNNSIYIIGTNTKFNIANTKGILTIGSKIAVGSNVRYINSIYSNTVLTVNSAFSLTSNDQSLIIF